MNAGFIYYNNNLYKAIYDNNSKNFLVDDESLIKENYYTDEEYNNLFESNNNFRINESNYKDFAEYKITFINNNSNYYIKNIERVK